jgi:hypothetical protein
MGALSNSGGCSHGAVYRVVLVMGLQVAACGPFFKLMRKNNIICLTIKKDSFMVV